MTHILLSRLLRTLILGAPLLAAGAASAQPAPPPSVSPAAAVPPPANEAAPAGATQTASLTITFSGIKTPSGTLMLSLDGSEAAFGGKAPAAGQASVAVSGEQATAVFTGLKPGTYAVRAFHDLNGDGVLNMNPFGIPTEPYAFSNNARGKMGPPKWDAASFTVVAGDNAQTITIN